MAKHEENPANETKPDVGARKRIPMSVPRQRLEVNDIPGYHLHWMSGRPGRIPQAMQAGYEFVDIDEVVVQNMGIADDIIVDGNSDLGSRVSVVCGAGEGDQPERLYLMKLREEWWQEDQAELRQKNKSIEDQIRRGVATADTPGDTTNRYVKISQTRSYLDTSLGELDG